VGGVTGGVAGSIQPVQPVQPLPPAKPSQLIQARYPGATGIVKLRVTIGKDGVVHNIEVLDGPAASAQAAIDAVRRWVYQPKLENGHPVEVTSIITVNFV